MSNGVKKNRLTPHQYDEVSLVDLGANQDSHVLIYKRQDRGELRGGAPRVPDKPGNFKFKTLTQDPKKTLDAKVKGVKTVSGSSGSKKGRKKGTTQRAKNWKENRHPRNSKGSGDASGEFTTTSADSKRKYGKNGTTKAKLESGKTRKTKTAPSGKTKVHTTVKGDTLWDLAQKYLGDGRRWKEIGRLNGITTEAQARKLQIGVKLKLPGGGTSSAKKTSAKKTKKTKAETTRVTRLVMEPGGRIHRETVTRKKTNPVPTNPSAHPKRTWKPPVKKTPPKKRNSIKKNDLLMSWIDPNKEAH